MSPSKKVFASETLVMPKNTALKEALKKLKLHLSIEVWEPN